MMNSEKNFKKNMEKKGLVGKMNWKEPENYKDVNGFVLVSKYYHKAFKEPLEAIANKNIEGDWEIIHISKETEDAFYGMPLEGIGLMDCMCLKTDCRPFNQKELDFWNGSHNFSMYRSVSEDLSYTVEYNIEINDLMKS